MTTASYQCNMPTQAMRMCKRPATKHYVQANGECIRHYCRQHANGAGAAKLLRPNAWEYDHVESYNGKGR